MLKRVIVFFTLILFAGCATKIPKPPEKTEVSVEKTSFSFDKNYPQDLDIFTEYRLNPGDVLDILFQFHLFSPTKNYHISIGDVIKVEFIDIPKLNQTQKVMPDGSIVLPYIGKFYVYNKTVGQITKELKKAYKKVFRDPQILVSLADYQVEIKELKKDLHTAPRGLSKLVTIRPDGYATFPLIGDVFAANRTVPELRNILNEKYSRLFSGLSCELFLEKASGALLYVLGEVGKPGIYRIKRPLNIMQAIVLAGGYTTKARLDKVAVFRKKRRKIAADVVNLKNTLELAKNPALFYLRPGDLVYVPRRKLSTFAEIMTEVSNLLLFRGWSFSIGVNYDLNRYKY